MNFEGLNVNAEGFGIYTEVGSINTEEFEITLKLT